MMFTPNMTIGEAQVTLRRVLYEGLTCPVCTQYAKIYRWSLYATAAHCLLLLYRAGGTQEFVHTSTLKEMGHKGQGDHARLRLWGLVEQNEEPRADGGKSGWWRVTAEGERFARGESAIPKYAYVYDSRLIRVDGPRVTIRDALGKRFNYDEIMAAAV